MINRIKLPNSNIPILGLGTWKLKGHTCTEVIKKALNLGYTHFDTAEVYGNEIQIGKAIKNINRKDIYLTSKIYPSNLNYEKVIDSCNNSLKNLQTDYIDLYLLHWPEKNKNYKEIFKAFKELQKQNKIKSVGVSNFSKALLENLKPLLKELDLQIENNQIEINPYINQNEIINYCKKENISLTAYSPLAKGWALEDKLIISLAKKYKKTPSQVILRCLVQQEIIVIPKASSIDHLKENLDIFDFDLEEKDIDKINDISK